MTYQIRKIRFHLRNIDQGYLNDQEWIIVYSAEKNKIFCKDFINKRKKSLENIILHSILNIRNYTSSLAPRLHCLNPNLKCPGIIHNSKFQEAENQ